MRRQVRWVMEKYGVDRETAILVVEDVNIAMENARIGRIRHQAEQLMKEAR